MHLPVESLPSGESGKTEIREREESEESGNWNDIEDEIHSEYDSSLFRMKGEKF